MLQETRLPRNKQEGLLFLLIVSLISVNTIAPTIVGLERGFSKEVYLDTLQILPVMWIIVVLLVKFVAGPIVGRLLPKFVGQTDGFNARVLFNIVLNVLVLSLILSIIGTWVGTKQISLEPFRSFLHIWPRNFGVAFWIEMIIAQPIARFAMKLLHAKQAKRAGSIN
ncbi:hypothetical protein PAECIP111892_02889 [Paenibacillus auburnensis]|uniref:DUF2798 domain-containing protein n=1 Tax=Paenibacillus auburnensis TaxID=2905649 RepID=A0ABM9C8Z3_9BACL|nr:hypothetical protein [Paenibacillus auburnensis]CAH1207425.1 hypothetical protein PAECIP111892_02889 [Paenibacillus auburnensis]